MSQERSDPELLLRQIQKEEAKLKDGKLKIYLGSAPGVGKTYKMLHDAFLNRAKNLDVVIGIVESHGRHDIEKMLKKFETIDPQYVTYRDKRYAEFDLDAVLNRNPGLVLVDEMAHTNISGLRHEKRWQDIKELLDRGIDVYTTLNVQHIESLKDAVMQIIHAPVMETVPDFMIERANTIELVDLPLAEHLKRLKEGKIYIPEQADLAAEHFFREGNLIALRELALRVTANVVEMDVQSYRKSEGIEHIWPIRDKILVCVGPNRQSLKLIRTAKRLAAGLQAPWIAIYIDTPNVSFSAEKRELAIENLRLAEQFGAVTHVLMGNDIVKEVLQFARESNVTQIMISKDRTRFWRHLFRRRLADEIIAHSGEINVSIVAGQKMPQPLATKTSPVDIAWRYYSIAGFFVTWATVVNVWFRSDLSLSIMVMNYLLAVMFTALLGRVGPSIMASTLSVIAFDFFCMTPFYQFTVTTPNSIITLVMMLLVSLAISYLTLVKDREVTIARQIQQQTRALYIFSRDLSQTRGIDDILALSVRYIAQSFQVDVIALMPKDRTLDIRASQPEVASITLKDKSVAQWVYDMVQPAGLGSDTLSSANAMYLPLANSEKQAIGVLRIQPHTQTLFTPDQLRLLESCVNQMALALEIDRLQEKSRKKQLKIEIDTAKNSLLKTISTQLNYPLKFILGVIGASVKGEAADFSVDEELNKISLINNNIIQVLAFEAQKITLKKQATDFLALVQASLAIFAKTNHQRTINIHSDPSIPSIVIDSERIQEALMNLLDNAVKYSPHKTPIDIYIQFKVTHLWVSIENTGTLLEKGELTQVFNPFYHGEAQNQKDSLGLGLTLCQLNIEAHGGEIWAENIHEKGIVAFRFTLPCGIFSQTIS